MDNLTKVLIIGSIWPYHPGGARINPLAKYLNEFGWVPIVVTMLLPQNADLPYKVIEVPYHNKLFSLMKHFGINPEKDAQKQIDQKFNISSQKTFKNSIFMHLKEIATYTGCQEV